MMMATEPKRRASGRARTRIPTAAEEAARLHQARLSEMNARMKDGFARYRVSDPGEDDQDANYQLRGPSPRMNTGAFGMS